MSALVYFITFRHHKGMKNVENKNRIKANAVENI